MSDDRMAMGRPVKLGCAGTMALRWAGAMAFCLLTVCGAPAGAQGNSASMEPPILPADACKREVMKYQGNVDLVRKSLGDRAAEELEGRFMPRSQWDALLLKEGYCGIARRLRAQKLTR